MKKLLIPVIALSLYGLGLIFGPTQVFSKGVADFSDPVGYINDFAGVLSNDADLNEKLSEFEKAESTQILVITVDNLPDDVYLENFIPRLIDENPEWAAGQEEFDNGVILTIVVETREMRIDVGYGLEGALPDITASHILDYEVRPYFRDDDYDAGVEAGLDAIMASVKGEYVIDYEQIVKDEEVANFLDQAFFVGFFGIFLVVPYLAAFLGRTKSWWLGGVLGFIAGVAASLWVSLFDFWGFYKYFASIVIVPVLTLSGLFLDWILSKNYKIRRSRGMSTGWFRSFGGFSSGSSGFSGGSSGGFSSGGGSFGGGGSSSSW
ncbi:MAG: TPM domain-containing protein [Patescibacteria group bacterium]|nr:TPM domain-containing protein [Patescibacteria group bacterium]